MGFKCGIVGLPNVGKSTLFNALTQAAIAAENFPFCTIDPNVGIVPINDLRLNKIAKIIDPQNIIPTSMTFVDIAGLVAGASKGEGLGNKFLANIRETDAIAHVVRCFEDENVIHVSGTINPLDDIEVINMELIFADMESIEKALQKAEKNAKSGNKEAKARAELMQKILAHLESGSPVRTCELSDSEKLSMRDIQLLTNKPTMYIANVADDGFEDNPMVAKVTELAEQEGASVVPVCASLEAEISELDGEERDEFLADLGLEESGLDRVAAAGYRLLGLQTYFTAGVKEVRAWTVREGASAPQAAGVIHTDFERTFIRAEVVGYDDFIEYGGEQGAKDAGKWRLEGKDYIVQDGDVMHFRSNP